MAGRAFAFADPRIIALAKTQFVPVCADDWYQRRRKDDEGEFFRKMADQGPRKGAGGSTRQGIYTFTADGELLEFKNAGQDAQATFEQLERAIRKWKALPVSRRQPGAVEVPAHGKLDANYSRTPPENGLIVKVNGRILDLKDGDYIRGTCDSSAAMKASRDFLWLTADEVKLLVPSKLETGSTFDVPAPISKRIVRFHLLDNTRGEPAFWKREDVKTSALKLTVTSVDDTAFTLRLEGNVLLTTAKTDRGYDAHLGGILKYDRRASRFVQFDIAVIGNHWGDDSVTGSGCRPGKTPFGVAFTLADAKVAANRVPPQAARDWGMYMGKD